MAYQDTEVFRPGWAFILSFNPFLRSSRSKLDCGSVYNLHAGPGEGVTGKLAPSILGDATPIFCSVSVAQYSVKYFQSQQNARYVFFSSSIQVQKKSCRDCMYSEKGLCFSDFGGRQCLRCSFTTATASPGKRCESIGSEDNPLLLRSCQMTKHIYVIVAHF